MVTKPGAVQRSVLEPGDLTWLPNRLRRVGVLLDVLEPGDLTWLPNVTKLDASEKVGVGF